MEVSILRNNKKVYDYKTVKITDEVLNDLVKTNKSLKYNEMKVALQLLFAIMMLSTIIPVTYGAFSHVTSVFDIISKI